MKHNYKMLVFVLASAVGLTVALTGCIRTSYQAELLRKYQQLMTNAAGDSPVEGRVIANQRLFKSAGGDFLPVTKKKNEQTGITEIELSLPEAVQRALANSPTIMVSAFDPAITREQITNAEAAFDPTFVSVFGFSKRDTQVNYSGIGREKVGSFQTALSQNFLSGAQAQISYSLQRTHSYNPSYFNDPNYASRTAINLTQPLLRGFGTTVNSAQIRVSRISHNISMLAFRSQVMSTLESVQALYWRLAQARQDVEIQKRLLARAEKTLEHVQARSELDASRIQITDALATVESSRLMLVQAQKLVGDVQDNLVQSIGDPSLQLMGDYSIIPTTTLSDAPLKIDVAEQLATALKNNPDIEQYRRELKIRDIAILAQKNLALPILNLEASLGYNGAVSDNAKDSFDQMAGGDYIDYSVEMNFQWPLGNRLAKSALREAKHNRGKSIATLQAVSDQLAVGISTTARTIHYSYEEIMIGRRHVKATLDNLDAMEARRETVQAMTPEFLNQLLNAQEKVAEAERSVLQAIVDYNTAQATLARVNGTAMKEMGVIIKDSDDVLDLLNSYVDLGSAGSDTPAMEDQPENMGDSDKKDENEKSKALNEVI